MHLQRRHAWLLATTIFLACGSAPGGLSLSDGTTGRTQLDSLTDLSAVDAALCPTPSSVGFARCFAHARLNNKGMSFASASPVGGFTPHDLQNAYVIPSNTVEATIALVDAQDDPTAENDLMVYRAQYGLPPCTTANGCFRKVNQNGQSSPLPSADTGWAGEIALDIEMASAACPSCKILLVEANTPNQDDLGVAVVTAARLGASVISNSYGAAEDSGAPADDSQYFNQPGIAIFAAAGDGGYGAQYPATSYYVTAVGGTSLSTSGSARGWSETVWNSGDSEATGSGCSAYISKPSWQTDSGCSTRVETDVSAVADPATGVAVYDSTGSGGWSIYGGTSAATPLVAGIYAQTGNSQATPEFSYAHPNAFNDVISGNNGSCSPSYLCTAQIGDDGPTGNGTPNGKMMASDKN